MSLPSHIRTGLAAQFDQRATLSLVYLYKVFIHLFSFWLRYAVFSAFLLSCTAKTGIYRLLSVLAGDICDFNSPKKITISFGGVDFIEEKH